MRRTHRNTFVAAVLTTLAALAAGCGDDEGARRPSSGAATAESSRVQGAGLRIVHAVPDLPAVDIYLQGDYVERGYVGRVGLPIATNVTYGTVTDFREVGYGSGIIAFRPAGTAPNSPPILVSDPVTLIPNVRVTVVATGMLEAEAPEESFRALSLIEHATQAPPAGTARVHIVHAGVDAPTVGIDVGNDGSIEAQNLGRFQSTGVAGLAVPAETALQLGIVSGETGRPLTAFSLPALPVGAELFVLATGRISRAPGDPQGFALLTVGQEGRGTLIRQNPVVYVLNAAPDAPALGLSADGAMRVSGLGFGELSAALQMPPGEHTLSFFGQPSGPLAARVQTPTLEAGQRYLLVASGRLGAVGSAPEFSLLVYREDFARAEESVRLRLVHASPDAPAVDVGVVTGQGLMPEVPLFQDVVYSEASKPEGEPVQPAAITLGVSAAPSTARGPVASFALDLSPFQGEQLFVVAAGALRPREGEEGFRLLLVNTSRQPWTLQEVLPR